MAHFVRPPGAGADGYTVDNRLAPGSVARVTVAVGSRRTIALWGGDGLWARSTDDSVAAYDAFNDKPAGNLRILTVFGSTPGTCHIEVGQGRGVWIKLEVVVAPKTEKQKVFIVRDVRLHGYKPHGDVLEVDENTPLPWVIDNIIDRGKAVGGKMRVIFMAHGLPGFVQCARGSFIHPTAGGGLTVADLHQFDKIKGCVEDISFYSCLVARIGSCFECGGHVGYDGNQFCYMMAQRTQSRVKASVHLQYYYNGTKKIWKFVRPDGVGITFGHWNGTVFTWAPSGAIVYREQFPLREAKDGASDPEGDYAP